MKLDTKNKEWTMFIKCYKDILKDDIAKFKMHLKEVNNINLLHHLKNRTFFSELPKKFKKILEEKNKDLI
jgi:hypothetical protein